MSTFKLSHVFPLLIPFWYFQNAGSSIIGCPEVTPSAISYLDNGVTWCYWLKPSTQDSVYQQLMCATNGGTLANIPSASHEAAVTTALGSTWSATTDVYIGVRDVTNTGNFQTWAGDTLTYTNWGSSEPQSFQFCVYMDRTTHLWHTTHCNVHILALCYCVIDSNDPYTCSGNVVTGTGGVTSSVTTVSSNTATDQTTSSNVCYPSILTSCLSCCYAQATPTTSSLGKSFTDIVADLKIDTKQTNRYQRKLQSVADYRPLSVGIGTIAILVLITVVAVIVTCDIPVLGAQFNLIQRSMRRLFCRSPKSRVRRRSNRVHSDPCDQTVASQPTTSTTKITSDTASK
ncbi:uncharacterized protein LOC110440453 [Mizuhopecten yessoensis]|uniref:uncharacterized protein LOC110440453 n=1 Tax=Mizuhopecten yessoensis TaxID=6573 RepID=UPI000B45C7F0|nr:uncharacterized protein LOC110440453 [Mizuhopecten yessoensis]